VGGVPREFALRGPEQVDAAGRREVDQQDEDISGLVLPAITLPASEARTVNRWNIPLWLEREVLARDRQCVYCGIVFDGRPARHGDAPSWEHIVNDLAIVTRENIVLCCVSCNSSKGAKTLAAWLGSRYCATRSITADSVAPIVRSALAKMSGDAADGAAASHA
jgi:hypothetical protein